MRTADDSGAMPTGDLERHGLGFARVAADGIVLDRRGEACGFLPEPGGSCFEAALLIGMEPDFADLRAGRRDMIALPAIGLGAGGEKTSVTIVWNAPEQAFSIAAARAFGASETETMLVRERRERRLADEQAEAERRRANVSEALYRDIVDSGSDFVLRLSAVRTIVFANRRLTDFAGASLQALVGREIADALPAREGGDWSAVAGEGAEISFEQRIEGADGKSLWVWWRAAWLGASGGPAEYQVVGRDVTLLRKLRAETERADAQARVALVMRERLKIAHDLHDTIVHALVAVVAQLRVVRKLAARAPAEAVRSAFADFDRMQAELADAETAARDGLARGREALGQVRFQRAGEDGLAAALQRAALRFEERTATPVELRIDHALAAISGETAEVLYRIVEEGFRNVEAHANASRTQLFARLAESVVQIDLSDDGSGFDPATDHPGHYGLVGMQEQARMIGAQLGIDSQPGCGVRLTLRAPVRAQE